MSSSCFQYNKKRRNFSFPWRFSSFPQCKGGSGRGGGCQFSFLSSFPPGVFQECNLRKDEKLCPNFPRNLNILFSSTNNDRKFKSIKSKCNNYRRQKSLLNDAQKTFITKRIQSRCRPLCAIADFSKPLDVIPLQNGHNLFNAFLTPLSRRLHCRRLKPPEVCPRGGRKERRRGDPVISASASGAQKQDL